MKQLPTIRTMGQKLAECVRDERGQAMTEYLIVSMAILPIAFLLFHPDNGLYQSARDQYELTTFLLILPGP